MNRRWAMLAATSGLLLLLAGCGGSTAVTGSVSYEGQPVESGSITFLPADGQGPSAGAAISGGQYRVDEITPGEKTVQIVGLKEISFARSSAEMAQQAEEAARRGTAAAPVEQASEIPANAEGNNATVEVKPGTQTLDFHLKRPPQS